LLIVVASDTSEPPRKKVKGRRAASGTASLNKDGSEDEKNSEGGEEDDYYGQGDEDDEDDEDDDVVEIGSKRASERAGSDRGFLDEVHLNVEAWKEDMRGTIRKRRSATAEGAELVEKVTRLEGRVNELTNEVARLKQGLQSVMDFVKEELSK
jgi:hypothetical protein